jgi:chaperonin GroEL (HSP60 family)
LERAGITAAQQLSASDLTLLSLCTGASILHQPFDLIHSSTQLRTGTADEIDLTIKEGGKKVVLVVWKKGPGPRTIVLRGGQGEVSSEAARGLQDALSVVKSVCPSSLEKGDDKVRIVLGGGCTEMALAGYLRRLDTLGSNILATSLERMVGLLASNAGMDVVRVISELQSLHSSPRNGNSVISSGIDGRTCVITDVKKAGIFEPLALKTAVIANAIRAATLILRIDTVIHEPLALYT